MSVFNGERYLKEAVDSILNQTFINFEFIVIDDASTDTSAEILENYARTDARIRICVNDRNQGLAISLNRGISLSCGTFIARMDADDISLPDRLFLQFRAFQENPAVDLVASAFSYIDDEGKVFRDWSGNSSDCYRFWRLQFQNVYVHSTVMFRKLSLAGHPYFYNENIHTAQDYELWCRIAKKDNTKYLTTPLVHYRVSPNQISQQRQKEQFSSALEVSFRNLLAYDPSLTQAAGRALCGVFIKGYLSLYEIKYLPALVRILKGFFNKHEISLSDRVRLILLVIKDIFYWLRRING